MKCQPSHQRTRASLTKSSAQQVSTTNVDDAGTSRKGVREHVGQDQAVEIADPRDHPSNWAVQENRQAVVAPGRRDRTERAGSVAQQLEAALRTDEHRPARDRRTADPLFEQIRALGYGGSTRALSRGCAAGEQQANALRRAAFVPMRFEMGDFQFDWSCE